MDVDFDQLLIPRLLPGGHSWLADQEQVRRQLEELSVSAELRWSIEAGHMFGAECLATPIYLLDPAEASRAWMSAGVPPTGELPPLPFPKLSVEAADDTTFKLVDLTTDDGMGQLEAFVIEEEISGSQWSCLFYVGAGDGIHATLHSATITEGNTHVEICVIRDAELVVLEDRAAPDSPHRSIAVETVHLITARGVTSDAVVPPRGVRRRFAHEGGQVAYPELHFVKIREAGESPSTKGTRSYHCRWLVRGHWRHLDNGKRAWVRSYVKGPAGAPWRGTPIYVGGRSEYDPATPPQEEE